MDGSSPALPRLSAADLRSLPARRKVIPLLLFVATCLTTFWAGVKHWAVVIPPILFGNDHAMLARWLVVANWQQGLWYMSGVIGILLAHEMGHFVATLICRIPASLPYFIPMPIGIGTMGAVIGMAGHRANRRQIFDIGIAGPLAGLVCLFPLLWLGIESLDLSIPRRGGVAFDCPWVVRLLFAWQRPDEPPLTEVWVSQLNPLFMAAWVGLLVTGLNMLPVSQLDGGHIVYALLRRKAHYVARSFLVVAGLWIIWSRADIWLLMLVLVTMIGVDHPPTADDTVPLGWGRTVLGYASLAIPFLCFPPKGIMLNF
jgi:membrane-associated protease RseP (regulator of RpoE activity)